GGARKRTLSPAPPPHPERKASPKEPRVARDASRARFPRRRHRRRRWCWTWRCWRAPARPRRRASEAEDLRDPDESRLPVAMSDLDPARRDRRGRAVRRLGQLEQHVLFGAEDERRRVVGIRADVE